VRSAQWRLSLCAVDADAVDTDLGRALGEVRKLTRHCQRHALPLLTAIGVAAVMPGGPAVTVKLLFR